MPNMSLTKNPMPVQEPDVRNHNFEEVALGYTKEQAVDEANRCLHCKHKPCVAGCPVAIDIPEFIAKIKEEDLKAHIRLYPNPALCLPYVGVSVHRRLNVSRSVCVGSRVSPWRSAAWNALSRITIWPTAKLRR